MKAIAAFFLFNVSLLFLACHPHITILSYNVENLFDDVDDGTEYEDFDPGNGKWNTATFENRLASVAEVVRRSVAGGPDVLALQEVEGEAALHRLCDEYLWRQQYAYQVIVPAEDQAVHCAVASRLPIRRVGAWRPAESNSRSQRVILEVEIVLEVGRLYLFNAHWKSKTGGVPQTEDARRSSAAILRERLAAILGEDPEADIVVLGDLNENIQEPELVEKGIPRALSPLSPNLPCSAESVYLTHEPEKAGLQNGCLALYETWFEIPEDDRWSYIYSGEPQTPDHILLTSGLFDTDGFFYAPGGFSVVRQDFLLQPRSCYPVRMREDGSGYSDHLPLLIRLRY